MKELHVITDLQFGSTGKGLFAGYLAKRIQPDAIVTAWGPNAGHTFVDTSGFKHVNIMIPNGIVAPSVRMVLIGPGSIIDGVQMWNEMVRYGLFDNSHIRVAIHENAAVVMDEHRQAESAYGFKIGSTMKGVGEAVMHKMRRHPPFNIAAHALRGTPLEGSLVGIVEYNALLDSCERVLLEGAQGFSLSLNQGMYPYCTSRDCTTHQLLSDCGLPARGRHMKVYGVARTMPIRVANRFDKDWVQIGTSGPGYPDQAELAWDAINREPELTTVTKLPRRIFSFSRQQIAEAVRMNGVDEVFLNFCNYVEEPLALLQIISDIEDFANVPVRYTGWGPREDQVKEAVVGDTAGHTTGWYPEVIDRLRKEYA